MYRLFYYQPKFSFVFDGIDDGQRTEILYSLTISDKINSAENRINTKFAALMDLNIMTFKNLMTRRS